MGGTMIRFSAFLLTFMFVTSQASAVVVRYDYQGDPFSFVGYGQQEAFNCTDHAYECDFISPGESWAGSITVDFKAAPKLKGETLNLYSNYFGGESYTVGKASATGPYTNYEWVTWLNMTGIFAEWQAGSIDTSDLSFSFDKSKNITCWSGYSFWGGDGDPGSTCGYDYLEYIDVLSTGPGTWTKTVVPPTPVPLPAGIYLLLSGIGALGFIASRKTKEAKSVG